jgi:hypothetical protein
MKLMSSIAALMTMSTVPVGGGGDGVLGGGGAESIVQRGKGHQLLLETNVLNHCLNDHINRT